MDWNCTLTEERLSDFLEGALAPEEAAAFSAHVESCALCGPITAQVNDVVSRMRQAPLMEEPPTLAGRILDATLGPRSRAQNRRRWFGWLAAVWQPQFAMGAATVAASFAILFHAVGPDVRSVRLADLNPATLVRSANRQAHLTYARGAKFVNDLRVVYEIQSRLGPQPEPAPQPSSPDPRDKSQADPRLDRRQPPEEGVLVSAVTNRWPYDSPSATRSRP
jgi:anti-sigma factor RsiW